MNIPTAREWEEKLSAVQQWQHKIEEAVAKAIEERKSFASFSCMFMGEVPDNIRTELKSKGYCTRTKSYSKGAKKFYIYLATPEED